MKQDAIWNYFQNEKIESFNTGNARQRYLLNRIPTGAKVLNIGIGNGYLENLALKRGIDFHTIDPNVTSVERLNREALKTIAHVGQIRSLPFATGEFDLAIVSEVLEHLETEDVEAGLNEIARVLRIGGRILVTVPANERLDDSICICPECNNRFHRWGHVQSFTKKRLTEILSEAFGQICIQARPFPNWEQLTITGRFHGILRLVAARAGIDVANLTFVAEGTRSA